ncbi:YdbL family protein [Shewanella inventionis]|uniref:DUF1318 domain-containing protein n=1 Tax=Shewanella inventionis TaxID=1738770 RepID=A0ABQ1JND0_9GAMM|nr:YdbL family protein [Shewanella inventionis]GGB72701.1 hypothetical protein GCM10011607_36450 [Shewanella inventionis]
MMKSSLVIVTLLATSILWCSNAWAVTLQQAKSSGWVGEQTNGYLGVIVDNAEVQQLVLTINAKRKQYYQVIATRNHISLDTVAKLAAQKAIQAAESGHKIQTPQGEWLTK